MKGDMEGKGLCLNTEIANMWKKQKSFFGGPQDRYRISGWQMKEIDYQSIQRGGNLAT